MVDDDHGHAELARFRQRLEAGGAAIDGDQQRGAFAGKRPHRLDVGAIALKNAVGDVDQGIEPAMAQMPGQQRRGGRAIDVVIAEDRDLLAARGRVGDALRRRLHRRYGMGIRLICGGGIEEIRDASISTSRPTITAPAFPSAGSAARSPAPSPPPLASSRSRHSFPSPIATRRETPVAIHRQNVVGGVMVRSVSIRDLTSSLRTSRFNVKASRLASTALGADPRVVDEFSPLFENRGRRECGCALHPRSRCELSKKAAHEHTGQRRTSDIPAQWLYGL